MYKVILVNDESLEIEALKIMINELKDELVIVATAENGKIAIEIDRQLEPDIIIIDNEMPGVGGIEASKIIKDRNKEKIIILLMEYYNFSSINEKIRGYFNEYILKPINKNYLIEVLNRQIKSLKGNINKLKEQELLLFDKIISNEENEGRVLLKNILNGYEISSNNICVFKYKVQTLLKKIIKVCTRIKYKNTKTICQEEYTEKIQGLNTVQAIYNFMNDILNIIYESNSDKDITARLMGDKIINKSLEPALSYIEQNYKERITLEKAANACNLSIYYFSKLFKKDIGMKFIDYINLYKVEKAKEMLSTKDMTILNIAIELGYEYPGYFSKVFKRIVKLTPSEYRHKYI